jgi:hypothetical protein
MPLRQGRHAPPGIDLVRLKTDARVFNQRCVPVD